MARNILRELHEARNSPADVTRLVEGMSLDELKVAITGLHSTGPYGEQLHAIRDACVVEAQRRLLGDHVAALRELTDRQVTALVEVSEKMIAAIDRMNKSTTRITLIAIAIGALGAVAGVLATIISAS